MAYAAPCRVLTWRSRPAYVAYRVRLYAALAVVKVAGLINFTSTVVLWLAYRVVMPRTTTWVMSRKVDWRWRP